MNLFIDTWWYQEIMGKNKPKKKKYSKDEITIFRSPEDCVHES